MSDKEIRKVFAYYRKQVENGARNKYLWDVQPYEYDSVKFYHIITDALYARTNGLPWVKDTDKRAFKSRLNMMPQCLLDQLEVHRKTAH